jgi:hypothetical protein
LVAWEVQQLLDQYIQPYSGLLADAAAATRQLVHLAPPAAREETGELQAAMVHLPMLAALLPFSTAAVQPAVGIGGRLAQQQAAAAAPGSAGSWQVLTME